MIEYFQRITQETFSVPRFAQVVSDVKENLSRQASATDDPNEYKESVQVTVERDSDDTVWVRGTLDKEPHAEYLIETVLPERYRIIGATRMIDGDSDLTPDELAEHLMWKESQ